MPVKQSHITTLGFFIRQLGFRKKLLLSFAVIGAISAFLTIYSFFFVLSDESNFLRKTDYSLSPVLGLRVIQDGKSIPLISDGWEKAGRVEKITLDMKRLPFEIYFPEGRSLSDEQGYGIAAYHTIEIHEIVEEGLRTREPNAQGGDNPFCGGCWMAAARYGSATLPIAKDMAYFVGKNRIHDKNGHNFVLVDGFSQFAFDDLERAIDVEEYPINELFLVIWRDFDGDKIVGFHEVEKITINFQR